MSEECIYSNVRSGKTNLMNEKINHMLASGQDVWLADPRRGVYKLGETDNLENVTPKTIKDK